LGKERETKSGELASSVEHAEKHQNLSEPEPQGNNTDEINDLETLLKESQNAFATAQKALTY